MAPSHGGPLARWSAPHTRPPEPGGQGAHGHRPRRARVRPV